MIACLALAFAFVHPACGACGPNPDPIGEQTCKQCPKGTSPWTCLLDIRFQIADEEVVKCLTENKDVQQADCDEACLEWSKTHTRACLSAEPNEPFTCHGGGTGAVGGGSDTGPDPADSTAAPESPDRKG